MENPASLRAKIFLATLTGLMSLAFSQTLPTNVTLETFYDSAKVNLRADSVKPVWVEELPGLPKHLYVMDLKGKIWSVFPDTTGYSGLSWYNYQGKSYKKTLVADFSSETAYSGEGEAGAYSIAFHPNFNYTTNRKFYVYYYRKDSAWAASLPAATTLAGGCACGTTFPGRDNFGNAAGVTTLDEWELNATDFTKATRTRQGIFKYPHLPSIGGGTAKFGPDGMMYLTVSDYSASARDTTSYARKVLRIDLTTPPAVGKNYVIPPDNPYANNPDTAVKKEIWAIGFRNPWTTAFDKKTGDLWLGDVDQGTFEELNLVVKSGNYGWDKGADLGANGNTGPNGAGNSFSGKCATGAPTTNRPLTADCPKFKAPDVAFPRTGGSVNLSCIIVGTVFNGDSTSPFYGRVLGADVGAAAPSTKIWAFKKGDTAAALIANSTAVTALISGADHRGIAAMSSGIGGTVYVPVMDWNDPRNRAYPKTGRYYELYRLASPDLTLKSYAQVLATTAVEKQRLAEANRRIFKPKLMVSLGAPAAKASSGKTYDLSGKRINGLDERHAAGVYYLKPEIPR